MGSVSTTKNKRGERMRNFISWFEIPAMNFENAVNFYNHIYNINMEVFEGGEHSMAFFPSGTGVGGAVVSGPGLVPSETGPLLYLNGGRDLDNILSRVEEAGGRIVMSKTHIGNDSGYFAIFIDCEGNKLALHSKN